MIFHKVVKNEPTLYQTLGLVTTKLVFLVSLRSKKNTM